jgi:diguanylate cyclase (GGDEF)-like protein
MSPVLPVLWVDLRPVPAPSDAPSLAGVSWTSCHRLADIAARLDADPAIVAVVLRVPLAANVLPAFELPDAPIRRRAVLVWAVQDDPGQDGSLYMLGVQEVLTDADGGGGLARRLHAAIERKRVEAAAARAYATDPLTGLVNRQQLVEHLSHLLAVRAREPAPIGLVVLQVGFAQPLAGTPSADASLLVRRKIGVRLRAGVRASDVVASIDADTYAVMLSSIDSPADAKAVATKLALALRHPFTVAGQAVSVPVEVGYAVAPDDGTEPEPLIRRAAQRTMPHGFKARQAANDP